MLLVTALASSKMFFTYIDRKRESLFSVCLVNASQGIKENHIEHLKPVCDSILSATPF